MLGKKEYAVWPKTDSANENLSDLFKDLSYEEGEIENVHGNRVKVFKTYNVLIIDRVRNSQAHRNDVQIYVYVPEEERWQLCYPRVRF